MIDKESTKAAARENAIQVAWATGRLRYKLDTLQRQVYDGIEKCDGSFYFNKPRRIGGSYLLCVRAVEQCVRKPNAQVRYAAPTAKALRKIVQPNLRKVLADCPVGLRPKWSTLEQEYRFPNGSTLAIAGCDAQRYEDLRGTESDEIYMDEVGFIDDLDYILNDVLMPQVQHTGGKVILVSTPARSPSHPSVKLALRHMQAGRYFSCTVWDGPRQTREQKEAFFKTIASGEPLESFYQTSMFRREYMAEFVVDEERAVIPEWTKKRQLELVREVPMPDRYDAYVGIDLGWRDGSAFVLGYWDFKSACLVITDEHLAFRTPIDQFQEKCLSIEQNRLGTKTPIRVIDHESLVIAELNRRKYYVREAVKRDKELSINLLRELIRDGKFVLHPRCKQLNAQLTGTVWNQQRTSFERDANGHGDLLDALIYLNRIIPRNKDPYAGIEQGEDFNRFSYFEQERKARSSLEKQLENVYGGWGVA